MKTTIHTPTTAHNSCPQPRTAMPCLISTNPRYVAFLRSGHADCTGQHNMTPFMTWVQRKAREFRTELGIHQYAPLPQDVFTRWLDERTRRYVDCTECLGDGHWHGEHCYECDGTGLTPDTCHPNVRGCRTDPCFTNDEWAALKLSRSMRVDFDQNFEETEVPW